MADPQSAVYRVFVYDKTNSIHWPTLQGHLKDLFVECTKQDESPFIYAQVHREGRGRDYELLVYLVASHRESRIRRVDRTARLGQAGTAMVNHPRGNVSEVYLDEFAGSPGLCLAKMAFHELMHNKLQMGDELHVNGGLGLASGMEGGSGFCAAPFNPFGLNLENKQLMAKALSKPVAQRWDL